MKANYIKLCLFFLLTPIISFSQKDFIIKYSGDTILCTIEAVKTKNISYILDKEKNVIFKIPTYEVKDYQWNSEPPAVKNNELLIDVGVGPAYRLGNPYGRLPESYIKDVRNGSLFTINIKQFNKKNYGFGGKLAIFNSYASIDSGIVTLFNDSVSKGNFSDDVNFTFVGPSYFQRFPFQNNKGYSHLSISAGYTTYKNKATYYDTTMNLRSNGLAILGSLGYNFNITKRISANIDASIMWSAIKTKKIVLREFIYDIDGLGQSAFASLTVSITYKLDIQ